MHKSYIDNFMDIQPLLKYLEEKYPGRYRIFNLVITIVSDSISKRDMLIEDLCTTENLKIFNWHRIGKLTDVIYSKYLE